MRKFEKIVLPDPLELRKMGKHEFILLADFSAFWTEGAKEYRYKVNQGFVTDLSSIPRWARSIIPQIGLQDGPSVIHDAMYVRREPGWTRKEVDQFFLEAMKSVGVKWIRRRAMYLAVRIGGQGAWDDDE